MGNYLIKKQGKFPVFTIRFIRISCRSFFCNGPVISFFSHIATTNLLPTILLNKSFI